MILEGGCCHEIIAFVVQVHVYRLVLFLLRTMRVEFISLRGVRLPRFGPGQNYLPVLGRFELGTL